MITFHVKQVFCLSDLRSLEMRRGAICPPSFLLFLVILCHCVGQRRRDFEFELLEDLLLLLVHCFDHGRFALHVLLALCAGD